MTCSRSYRCALPSQANAMPLSVSIPLSEEGTMVPASYHTIYRLWGLCPSL